MKWTTELDDQLRALYATNEKMETARLMGLTEAQVRQRASRLGIRKIPSWTDDEIMQLRAAYENARCGQDIGLEALAVKLGRLKSNVCRKARELGLTNSLRKKKAERKVRQKKYESPESLKHSISERIKTYIKEKGHPRGMSGKKHTQETKKIISEKSTQNNAARTEDEIATYNRKAMETKLKNGTYVMPRAKTTWKSGWREIGGQRCYFRSRWEANYARVLQMQVESGEIICWEHEPEVFWFDGIKRGCVSYLPDFRVTTQDGSIEYHEVKGWMDAASKTKLQRMKKYHPNITMVLIDSKKYALIQGKYRWQIDEWEW